MSEDDERRDKEALLFHGTGVLNPPSAVTRAAELGAAWAEDVARRTCQSLAVVDWPVWPPYDQAKPAARAHAGSLVAALHVHLAHPSRDPEARTPAAIERQEAAAEALARLCYEAARTRYLELAAWRLS